ncbi:hypothetical protein B0H19DRAFT_1087782 [Mycena capillaripes]|nr:hypothetical protein B0H19DRAFT_1087782 [Mycena capillaripes]
MDAVDIQPLFALLGLVASRLEFRTAHVLAQLWHSLARISLSSQTFIISWGRGWNFSNSARWRFDGACPRSWSRNWTSGSASAYRQNWIGSSVFNSSRTACHGLQRVMRYPQFSPSTAYDGLRFPASGIARTYLIMDRDASCARVSGSLNSSAARCRSARKSSGDLPLLNGIVRLLRKRQIGRRSNYVTRETCLASETERRRLRMFFQAITVRTNPRTGWWTDKI